MQHELSRDRFDAVIFDLDGVVVGAAEGPGSGRARGFPGTVEFLEKLRAAGLTAAVFSTDRGAAAVLDDVRLGAALDLCLDAGTAVAAGLSAEPGPMLNLAAERLGRRRDRCVVVSGTPAVVEAAATGGFAWAVGVDRGDRAAAFGAGGADLVVSDLAELAVSPAGALRLKTVHGLPSAWSYEDALARRLASRRCAVLLDYDGTLTPIVQDHRRARLPEAMRDAVVRLASRTAVAVISGRDLEDVRTLVGIESIFFSGSHGLELEGPGGWHYVQPDAADFIAELDDAEAHVRRALHGIEGHLIERKRFSVAVHYRQVAEESEARLKSQVEIVLARHPRLRPGLGKKVIELQPRIEWDKGRAVEQLLEKLGLTAANSIVIYMGDDLTDEAAFRVLRPPHVGIVIRDGDRPTSADYALADSAEVQRFLEWLARVPPLRS